MRFIYIFSICYILISVYRLYDFYQNKPRYSVYNRLPVKSQKYDSNSGQQWFQRFKRYCNPVELGTKLRSMPPPDTNEGIAYKAACYALAGKTKKAEKVLDNMPSKHKQYGARIVFNVGHPVADAGDDEAAGPIMRLVLKYLPKHYMALYHAGLSEEILGEYKNAKIHLNQFLDIYKTNDGWRNRAKKALGRIQGIEEKQ